MDHQVGPWWPLSMVRGHGPTSMVQPYKNQIWKHWTPPSFKPFCGPRGMTMDQKLRCLFAKINAQKDNLKEINFDHYLGFTSLLLTLLLVFTCFHFEFLQAWLEWRRGGWILLCSRGYTCFGHAYEAYCGHSSIVFERKVGEIYNFEFGLWKEWAKREKHMELRMNIWICRIFCVGIVDGERV